MWCSPACCRARSRPPRSWATAFTSGIEPVSDCDYCEIHPGECDGLTWDRFREQYGRVVDDPDQPMSPGGESLRTFDARVRRATAALLDAHRGRSVVMFTHGGFVTAALLFPARRSGSGRLRHPTLPTRSGQHLDHGVLERCRRFSLDVPSVQRRCAPLCHHDTVVTAALHLEGISLELDGTTVLSDVTWTVATGERWVVLGPNGAGKTTLLRVSALYQHPSRGTVDILGNRLGRCDVRTLPRADRVLVTRAGSCTRTAHVGGRGRDDRQVRRARAVVAHLHRRRP